MSRIHPSFHSGSVRKDPNTQRVTSTTRVSPIPQASMSVNNSSASANSNSSSALDLASLFECPICFDYALPPILQCQSGHIVCSICRSKLTTCPTCRGPLENIRNLAMEKLAVNVQFPCKYVNNGCHATLLYNQKLDHEMDCEYRPYSCPCPGASCKWTGPLEQVMNHLLTQHKSITTLQGEDIVFLATDINLGGAVDWVMMQSCFGHHFMLVLEKQDRLVAPPYGDSHGGHNVVGMGSSSHQGISNTATVGPMTSASASNPSTSTNVMNSVPSGSSQIQQFYAVVQLIGTRKQAEQFLYRLELNAPRRRQCWEATPRSIHDGVQSAIASSDCLMFDNNVANLFSEHGNLGINVTISLSSAAASPT